MSNNDKPEVKKASLSNDEREMLVFYMREQVIREMEAEFWAGQKQHIMSGVMQRLALDPNKYSVNWQNAAEGEITYALKPQPDQPPMPVAVPGAEETKPEDTK